MIRFYNEDFSFTQISRLNQGLRSSATDLWRPANDQLEGAVLCVVGHLAATLATKELDATSTCVYIYTYTQTHIMITESYLQT